MILLKNLDIFGTKPSLYLNKKATYDTVFGGLVSLIIIFISLYLTISYSQELFQRNKPTFSSYSESIGAKTAYLNASNLLYAYVVIDQDGNFISFDEDFFILKSFIRVIDDVSEESETIYNINFEECKEDNLVAFESVSDNVKNNLLKYGKCLNLNNIPLYGSPSITNDYTQFKFQVKLNFTKTLIDSTASSIFNSFNSSIVLYQQNMIYDPYNFHKPNQITVGSHIEKLFVTSKRTSSLALQVSSSETDSELLFSNTGDPVYAYSFSNYMSTESELLTETAEDSEIYLLFESSFTLSDKIEKHSRNYQNIADTLSMIGGNISIMMMIGRFLLDFVVSYEMFTFISDQYYFPNEERGEQKKKNDDNLITYLSNSKIQPIEEKKANQFIMEIKKSFRQKNKVEKRKAKKNFLQKIFFCFSANTRRISHFEVNPFKLIEISLDTVNIIQGIDDVHLLKYLLLSKEENLCFNYIKRSHMFNDTSIVLNSKVTEFVSNENDSTKIITYFRGLNRNMSSLDNKLIYLLADDIKKCLQIEDSPTL